MVEVPFNEQIYNEIKTAGSSGITKKALNQIFNKHSASSIAGVLHGMKDDGRIISLKRGEYCVSDNNTFASKTNIKRVIAKDLLGIKEKYDLKMSDFNSLTEEQQRQLREASDLIDSLIGKLNN